MTSVAASSNNKARLLLGDNSSLTVEISKNYLAVKDRRATATELCSLAVPMVLLTTMNLIGIIVAGAMALVAIRHHDVGAAILSVVVSAVLGFPLFGWFRAQGFFFPWVVILTRNRYRFSNGANQLHLRIETRRGIDVLIHSSYSRGDWGYAASIRKHGSWFRWPLVRPRIVGSKMEAMKEASMLAEWLSSCDIVHTVSMKGWKR